MQFQNQKGKNFSLEQIHNLLRKKYIDINYQELPPDPETREIALSFAELFLQHEDEKFAQALVQVQADSILFMAQLIYLGMKLQSTITKNDLFLVSQEEVVHESTADHSFNDPGTNSV